MSRLDAIIAALSPRWAAGRAYYRAVLDHARAYDAAKVGRRTDGWATTGAGANAEIGPANARIRARARDLVRNNPYAASAVRKMAVKTIGTGIVPRLAVGREEVERKQAARDTWNGFVENCDPGGQVDFYGLQNLIMRAVYEAGECLVRFVPRPASWRLPVPLQLEVLEPDYLDTTRDRALDGGGAIIQGVEFDAFGRRVAYWLFDQHPGEMTLLTKARFESRRVAASEVLHVFDMLRPGQARGVSMFTPVVLRMRDLDDYDDAELVRKKIAACFVAFVTRGSGPSAGPLASKTETDASGRRIEKMSPGLIQSLGMGDDVKFGTPPASEGYEEFMVLQLHAVAAGVGMTYEQLTGDLSRVNYSSIRAGLVDVQDLIEAMQWRVVVHQLCRPTWNRVGALAGALGRRDLTKPWVADWTPPPVRMIDPIREGQANTAAMRSGQKTLGKVVMETTGANLEDHLGEIERTNALLDEKGIVLDSDPRKTSNAGLTQARPPGTEIPSPDVGDGSKENSDA